MTKLGVDTDTVHRAARILMRVSGQDPGAEDDTWPVTFWLYENANRDAAMRLAYELKRQQGEG